MAAVSERDIPGVSLDCRLPSLNSGVAIPVKG